MATLLALSEFYGRTGQLKRAKYFNNLEKARKKILTEYINRPHPSKEALEKYENLLNSAYYPDTSNEKAVKNNEKYIAFVTKMFEKMTGKVLQNFNPGDINYNIAEDELHIALNHYESFQHTKYIELETLEQRIRDAQNLISKIRTMQPTEATQAAEEKAKTLIDVCRKAISVYSSKEGQNLETLFGLEDKRLYLDRVDGFKELIEQSDSIYQTLTTNGLTSSDIGLIGEIMAAALNYNAKQLEEATKEEIADKFFEDFSNKVMSGTRTIAPGAINYVALRGVSIGKNEKTGDGTHIQEIKDSKGRKTYQLSFGEGNSKITFDFSNRSITSAGQGGKQIKMDVDYSDAARKNLRYLRANVKNFSSNVSIEGSNLLNILQRFSSDAQILANYGYLLGDYYATDDTGSRNEWSAERISLLHNYAKTAILLDTLTGYAQRSGYANVLVINKRNSRGGALTVVDLVKVFEQVKGNLWDGIPFIIQDYENDNIYSTLRTIYKDIYTEENSEKRRSRNLATMVLRFLTTIKPIIKFSPQLSLT